MVNYLLQIYVSKKVVAKADAAPTRYTQLPSMSTPQYAEALVTESARYGEVYGKYMLKVIFIEGFHESVRHSLR